MGVTMQCVIENENLPSGEWWESNFKMVIYFGFWASHPHLEIYFESWSSDRLGCLAFKSVAKQRRQVGLRLRNAEQSVLSVVVFVGLFPSHVFLLFRHLLF